MKSQPEPPSPCEVFPGADATASYNALREDFTRCARLDDVSDAVPPTTDELLRRELARSDRDAHQREQFVAMVFGKVFEPINHELTRRGVDLAWTRFHTLTDDDKLRARWYRMSAAEARAFEAAGALPASKFTRNLTLRSAAAAIFYLALWRAWTHPTPVLYGAAAAALAVYALLRWKLPIRPRRAPQAST